MKKNTYLNQLYDSLCTPDAWRYTSDNYATGTIATTVNATATGIVKLAITPSRLLSRWPGAIACYLSIRSFGLAPQTVPAGNAGIECLFYDRSGNVTPLGEYLSQSGGNSNVHALLNVPITDPSDTSVGTLSVFCSNVANANATYNYSFGFSLAYVLPVEKEEIVENHYHYHDRGESTVPLGADNTHTDTLANGH